MKQTKMKCVRCNGTGRANPMTWPDQGHKGGCRLCGGTGEKMVASYDSQEHRRNFSTQTSKRDVLQ